MSSSPNAEAMRQLAASMQVLQRSGITMAEAMQRLGAPTAPAARALERLKETLASPPTHLEVRDPGSEWAASWPEFGRQLLNIVKHEFWTAQGSPERSPGARWVR